MCADQRGHRAEPARQLFHDHRVRAEVDAEAAVLGSHDGPQDAEVGETPHDLAGVAA